MQADIFLTLLRCVSRDNWSIAIFQAYREYLHTVNHKPCTGIGEGFAGRVREARRCASRKKFWHLAESGLMAKKGLIRTIRKKGKPLAAAAARGFSWKGG